MGKNRKGFTMIELLATITILAILMIVTIPSVFFLINKSKEESRKSSRDTLTMATKSYTEANKDKLPKSIGDSRIIKANELKDSNYLKEEIKELNRKIEEVTNISEDIIIRVNENKKSLIRRENINGESCLVIPVSDDESVKINS